MLRGNWYDILNIELCKERLYVSPKLIVQSQLLIFGFIRQIDSNLIIPGDVFHICYCFHACRPDTRKYLALSLDERKKFKEKIGVSLSTQISVLHSDEERRKSLKLFGNESSLIDFVSSKAFKITFDHISNSINTDRGVQFGAFWTGSDFMLIFATIVEMYRLACKIANTNEQHRHVAMWILHKYGRSAARREVCFIDPNCIYDGPVYYRFVDIKFFKKDEIAPNLRDWLVDYQKNVSQPLSFGLKFQTI